MEEIKFEVQGSQPEPYIVTFTKHSDGLLTANCTCPAGDNGLHCKHRIEILCGDRKAIASENGSDVARVVEWIAGTPIEKAMQECDLLEAEAEAIKKRLTKAKKILGAVMQSGTEPK